MEADIVMAAIKGWLGNRVTRGILKWTVKRDKEGISRLERIIKRYCGMSASISFSEHIAYYFVSFILNRSMGTLTINREEVKRALKEPIVRRGIVNILEGIAYYGVQRPQTTAAPFLVVWNLTRQCNLRCKHCYENAQPLPAEDELTTEEAKRVIDEFAKSGVVAIAFSGGEPLLRRDFFELVKYAKSKEFYISVASNGTLITKEIATKLKESGIDYIEISLDGFEDVHDNFRGVKGAWKRTVNGIRNCVDAGIDTCVATTAVSYTHLTLPTKA